MIDNEKVIGPYKIHQFLGRGSFGVVRVATHEETDVKVAIKSIRKKDLREIREIERMDMEIKILTMVKHVNIVRLLEVFHTNAHINMVMDYVSEGSLEEFIEEFGPMKEVKEISYTKLILCFS